MTKRLLCAFLAVVMVALLIPTSVIHAHAASEMKASDDVVLYLKTMEGFTPIPRWDYVQWTVGYGNRCPDEHLERYKKEGIPIEEADALFLEQLVYFEDQVNAFAKRNNLTLEQQQFDAILSITYNCGAAWLRGGSMLFDAIVSGATGNTLIGLMSQWCTAGGSYLPGLMRRRLTEADMYLNGRYNTQTLDHYKYVFFDAGKGTASAPAQGFDCNLYAVPMVTAKRDGYTFLGWYTAETGGVKVTYLDENMHQMTLYAHWAEGDGEYSGDTDYVEDAVLVTVTGDVVNVRKGPGTSYPVVASVVAGEKIAITEVALTNGRLWGKFDKGWLCLEYTNYDELAGGGDTPSDPDTPAPEDPYEVPVYATVIGTSTLTVYNGPDTGYPKVGTLKEGDKILLVEVYKLFNTWWGRIDGGGWVCLNRYLLLHDDNMLAHSFIATITNSYLNVRSGPGTSYGWLSSLNKGDKVEILAVELVGSVVWGQFSGGWISLEYTDFDQSKLEQYWNHSYSDWYDVSAATCVTPGVQHRDCIYCNAFETRETELADHSFGQWYTTVEADCVNHGQERRDCTVCEAYEVRETELTDHSYGDWYVETVGTCVTLGTERRDCQTCDSYETRETEYGDHSYSEWYEIVPPTLSEDGVEQRDCQLCDHYETRPVAPYVHNYGEWYTTAEPTCDTAGEQRRDCPECGAYETREIPALGHSFGEWTETVAPSCAAPGEKCRECAICGEVERQEIPVLEHSFGEWYTIAEGNCTTDTVMGRDCGICGHQETKTVAAAGHTMGAWYTYREANCTTDGESRRECTVCDYLETKTIAATGHTMDPWYTYRESTCAVAGEKRRECEHCDHYESAALEKKAHSLGEWYTVKEATTTEKGEERRECANCDYYESRETECQVEVVTKIYGTLTGYHYLRIRAGLGVNYEVVGQLNKGDRVEILEFGYIGTQQWGRIAQGWICITGYMTLETVEEAVEHTHSFGEWYTVTAPTCTESGQQRRDCACGHQETKEIAAAGHTMDEWYTVKEATTTEKGLERRDCKNCDHSEERQTDKKVETVKRIFGTLTGYTYLSIRAGAGTNYDLVGKLNYGDRVEIFEIVTVGNNEWGRIEQGWICITGYMTLETVEEVVEHTHSFGDWYTITAPTCTAAGQQRRDCACGHFETKTVAATGHTMGDWYTVKEATTTEKGLERRDCKNCDHSEERQTDVKAETVTRIYGTLTGYHYLRIRAGLGVNYEVVGQLNQGDRVEILEFGYIGTQQWGRIAQGWICITGYMTLETVEEVVEHTHSFGDWYTVTAPTCTESGQQRRDCACGHSETKTVAATGHTMGEWYTVKEATVAEKGEERRDCQHCDHSETRQTEYQGATVTKLYATITASSLNVRSGPGTGYGWVAAVTFGTVHEVFEQVTVDGKQWGRIDAGWICLTGYTTLEEVTEPADDTTAAGVKMKVNASALNVRAGAGTNYDIVTSLVYGTEVTVYEQVTVGGMTWARIDQGWVSMAYLV